MKLSDIRPGMKLRAIDDYADCIKAGDTFDVFTAEFSDCCIKCASGEHLLFPMATDEGHIPELEEFQP